LSNQDIKIKILDYNNGREQREGWQRHGSIGRFILIQRDIETNKFSDE